MVPVDDSVDDVSSGYVINDKDCKRLQSLNSLNNQQTNYGYNKEDYGVVDVGDDLIVSVRDKNNKGLDKGLNCLSNPRSKLEKERKKSGQKRSPNTAVSFAPEVDGKLSSGSANTLPTIRLPDGSVFGDSNSGHRQQFRCQDYSLHKFRDAARHRKKSLSASITSAAFFFRSPFSLSTSFIGFIFCILRNVTFGSK